MSVLLSLSFELANAQEAKVEYPEQVAEIMTKMWLEGFNKSDPKNPGNTLVIRVEDMKWMLVRDHDCSGSGQMDRRDTSFHIKFDQLDFKLGAIWKGAIWKSDTVVRVKAPLMIERENETIAPNRLELVEE